MSHATIECSYHDGEPTWASAYVWPAVAREASRINAQGGNRAFDVGCGNGATAGMLSNLGFAVTGIDPSQSGIAIAKVTHPDCCFAVADAYEDLAARFGRFSLVVSLEVVEHVYDPRAFAKTLFDLLEPGGTAIVSTPYHGYCKNLALAISGRFDRHFTALWDGGHIKFWSIQTLGQLLSEAGFQGPRFVRVGRVPPLAKSMVALATRPPCRKP